MRRTKSYLLTVLLLSSACAGGDGSSEPVPPPKVEVPTFLAAGSLLVDPAYLVQPKDVDVVTLAGKASLAQSGSFQVTAVETYDHQVVVFIDATSGKPAYLGLVDPASGLVAADIDSTARALLLLNPFLADAGYAERDQYLAAVVMHEDYPALLSDLDGAYRTIGAEALDPMASPKVYERLVAIMQETMASLGGPGSPAFVPGKTPPHIEDVAGPEISFVNPRHCWYAAQIRDAAGVALEVLPIDRVETILSMQWGWPPIFLSAPALTSYELGDGEFEILVTRAFDVNSALDPTDPEGVATLRNVLTAATYLLHVAIGFGPELPLDISCIELSTNDLAELSLQLSQDEYFEALISVLAVTSQNAGSIAGCLFESKAIEGAEEYIKAISAIGGNVAIALKVLGLADTAFPFLMDWVGATPSVTYYLTQSNGVIVAMAQDAAPQAAVQVSPTSGNIGTDFYFDASSSTDDKDPLGALRFRWDWEGDGTWDTPWSVSPNAVHPYANASSFKFIVEVRDSSGHTSQASATVNVGGGFGSADHVKIFMDELPWTSNATIEVLTQLGFTAGLGSGQYEILASALMATVELVPAADLVIFANDQPQGFYSRYAEAHLRFVQFVNQGGSILWGACDQGWNGGSMAAAGLVLPGEVIPVLDVDAWNYLLDPTLALVAGMAPAMEHNWASHESFATLPLNATVYCQNESGYATLVEFALGGGWIMLTGQPNEHQYKFPFGPWDLEDMHRRILSHFLGVQPLTFPIGLPAQRGAPRGSPCPRPSFVAEDEQ